MTVPHKSGAPRRPQKNSRCTVSGVAAPMRKLWFFLNEKDGGDVDCCERVLFWFLYSANFTVVCKSHFPQLKTLLLIFLSPLKLLKHTKDSLICYYGTSMHLGMSTLVKTTFCLKPASKWGRRRIKVSLNVMNAVVGRKLLIYFSGPDNHLWGLHRMVPKRENIQ